MAVIEGAADRLRPVLITASGGQHRVFTDGDLDRNGSRDSAPARNRSHRRSNYVYAANIVFAARSLPLVQPRRTDHIACAAIRWRLGPRLRFGA